MLIINDFDCLDFDDCDKPGVCSEKATCVDGVGTFQCICPDGHTGDGRRECLGNAEYI